MFPHTETSQPFPVLWKAAMQVLGQVFSKVRKRQAHSHQHQEAFQPAEVDKIKLQDACQVTKSHCVASEVSTAFYPAAWFTLRALS